MLLTVRLGDIMDKPNISRTKHNKYKWQCKVKHGDIVGRGITPQIAYKYYLESIAYHHALCMGQSTEGIILNG